MTRSELKSLIKECLLEVIAEGVRAPISESRDARPAAPAGNRAKQTQNAPQQHIPRRTIGGMSLDRVVGPSPNRAAAPAPTARPRPATPNVRGLTSDPILGEIFADTASTTLQEQIDAERRGPATGGDLASMKMSQLDPSDIFGDASSNWAALAFADGRPE